MQRGTAFFPAEGTISQAIARGDGASATADGGDRNIAIGRGDGATAVAGYCDNNASATGDNSIAFAGSAMTTRPS